MMKVAAAINQRLIPAISGTVYDLNGINGQKQVNRIGGLDN
jgi:hypothetical protein